MPTLRSLFTITASGALCLLLSCSKKEPVAIVPSPQVDTADTVVVDTVIKDPMQSLFGVYDGIEHYTRYSITNYSNRTLILDTLVRSHVKVYRYGEGEVIAMVHTYLDPSSGDYVSSKYNIEGSMQYFYIDIKTFGNEKVFSIPNVSGNYPEYTFYGDSLRFTNNFRGVSGSTGNGGESHNVGHWKKVK